MAVRVFMGIHHNGYHSGSRDFIEASLRWPHLAGIDLHGTESFPVEDWTAPLWRRARAAGKLTKAHAGEFMGADMVRKVVKELGVRRVQHGVRAIEDPAVVDLLVRSGAVLDVCPISNLKLGVVNDLRNHPLPALLDAGVSCTISTDDPVSFGNRLDMEYAALHDVMGFGYRELGALARTGLEQGADIPLVREALGRLDHWVAAFAADADD
jgi:adenosine deaminase